MSSSFSRPSSASPLFSLFSFSMGVMDRVLSKVPLDSTVSLWETEHQHKRLLSRLEDLMVFQGTHPNSLLRTVLVYLSAEYSTMSVVWSTVRAEKIIWSH